LLRVTQINKKWQLASFYKRDAIGIMSNTYKVHKIIAIKTQT